MYSTCDNRRTCLTRGISLFFSSVQLEDLFRSDPVQSQPEGLVRNVSLHQPFASTSAAAASSAEGAFGAASQQTGTNEEYQQVRKRAIAV